MHRTLLPANFYRPMLINPRRTTIVGRRSRALLSSLTLRLVPFAPDFRPTSSIHAYGSASIITRLDRTDLVFWKHSESDPGTCRSSHSAIHVPFGVSSRRFSPHYSGELIAHGSAIVVRLVNLRVGRRWTQLRRRSFQREHSLLTAVTR